VLDVRFMDDDDAGIDTQARPGGRVVPVLSGNHVIPARIRSSYAIVISM